MAERNQEAYPFARPYANGQAMATRSDAESHSNHELRRKKKIKCLIYIVVFAVFQIIVITVFALTVMRAKSPKFRIQSITVEDLTTSLSNTANPSFTMKFNAVVTVKNPNFGRYKYDLTTISFIYEGTQVGDAVVPKETARTKSTRKTTVTGAVNTVNSNLAGDISAGSVTLSTDSKINGKVYLMNIIKKKKSAEMKCTMIVNLASKQVHDIKCK